MPHPRHTPPCFIFETPRNVYVLRRWFDDPVDRASTAAEVIVITHNGPLERHELRQRLESLDRGPASDFVLIDIAPHAGVVLDTWERGIEGYAEEHELPCRCYRNWWDANECTEVFEGAEQTSEPEPEPEARTACPSVHEPTPASHIQQNRRALTSSLPIVLEAIDDGDHELALEWIENMQSQLRGLHQLLTRAKQNGVDEEA